MMQRGNRSIEAARHETAVARAEKDAMVGSVDDLRNDLIQSRDQMASRLGDGRKLMTTFIDDLDRLVAEHRS